MVGPTSAARATSAVALASLLAGSGLLHLLVPGPYRQIVPHALGHARELVAVSGVNGHPELRSFGQPEIRTLAMKVLASGLR